MRRIVLLIVLLGVFSSVTAGDVCSGFSPSGYYFRPPRSAFFYRPDYLFYGAYSRPYLYSFAPYGYRRGYGNPYGYGGYYAAGRFSPYYPPGAAWVGGSRGTYSTRLQTPAGGAEFVRTNTSDLIFTVTPARAQIYIDDKLIGSARDYASHRDRYEVINGQHELRIEYPGYKPYRAEMNIQPNRTVKVEVQLDRAGGR